MVYIEYLNPKLILYDLGTVKISLSQFFSRLISRQILPEREQHKIVNVNTSSFDDRGNIVRVFHFSSQKHENRKKGCPMACV